MTTQDRYPDGVRERPAVPHKRISWGAVFAGAIIALAAQMVLNLLGIGVGLATVDREAGDGPEMAAVGTAAGWWLTSAGISAFLGGMVAGRLSLLPRRPTGALHGLVSWAVTTLAVFYLLTTGVGMLVGGAYSSIAATMSTPDGTAPAVTSAPVADTGSMEEITLELDAILGEVRSAADQAGADPSLSQRLETEIESLLLDGAGATIENRNRAGALLSDVAELPPGEAEATIERWQERVGGAVEQARQAAIRSADAAADTLADASIWAAVAMVVGAVAATLGGAMATPRDWI